MSGKARRYLPSARRSKIAVYDCRVAAAVENLRDIVLREQRTPMQHG
jgi:hypothetical protein